MIDILTQNAMELNSSEKDQLFKMLSENARILLKLVPDSALLKYIVSGYTDSTDPIIQAYNTWKNNN
jgi:hypothetical protein